MHQTGNTHTVFRFYLNGYECLDLGVFQLQGWKLNSLWAWLKQDGDTFERKTQMSAVK